MQDYQRDMLLDLCDKLNMAEEDIFALVSFVDSLADMDKPKKPNEKEFPGFAAWWKLYPKGTRKTGRPQCLRKWSKEKLEDISDDILSALEWWNKEWCKDAYKFVCGPHKWLNQQFWLTSKESVSQKPVPKQNLDDIHGRSG